MPKTNEIALIFPHQLLKEHPALEKGRPIWLVEEFLFFRQFAFHKAKLIFHRASMKSYEGLLRKMGYEVHYVDSTELISDVRKLIPFLSDNGVKMIHLADPTDDWLQRRLDIACKKSGINPVVYDSGLFINSRQYNLDYFKGRKKYFQTDFYTGQRKRLKILMDGDGQPMGGKWTFDTENRLRYPKDKRPPSVEAADQGNHLTEAEEYVTLHYKNNPGVKGTAFIYPTDHDAAELWLKDFLKNRFKEFGIYEDAMVVSEVFLHHSLLSPLINVGLLKPDQVIQQAIRYADKHDIPLNSLEGFIRQIIGWREFIRGVYEAAGRKERTRNFFGFKRKLPSSFWTGTTGILPVDESIKKVLKYGYCHHIERLMVLGNFMILCEFDPDEVYRWFMEMFIDAYDWVMVPNVYGMSQFSDGGLFATKPYISGSNYLMKMGDFEKGEWQKIWDALFWRFMDKHRDLFSKNPRMRMLLSSFDKMDSVKRMSHLDIADTFLTTL